MERTCLDFNRWFRRPCCNFLPFFRVFSLTVGCKAFCIFSCVSSIFSCMSLIFEIHASDCNNAQYCRDCNDEEFTWAAGDDVKWRHIWSKIEDRLCPERKAQANNNFMWGPCKGEPTRDRTVGVSSDRPNKGMLLRFTGLPLLINGARDCVSGVSSWLLGIGI